MKKSAPLTVAVLSLAAASLAACVNEHGAQTTTSPSSGSDRMTTPLKSADGTQVATATFEFANGYATVTVEAGPNQVLSPGFHGLQVHSVGACEPGGGFSSAGEVYQASNHTGYPASGDLTQLQVRPDGSAKLVTTTSAFTAADLRNSSGTSLVIHQNPGTFAGDSGEAGKRIACGVIATANTTTASSSTTTTTTTSVSTVTTTVAVPPPETSTVTVTSTTSPTGGANVPTVTTTAPKTVSPPPGG